MTNQSRVVLYVGMTSRLDGRVSDHKNHAVEGFTSKYKVNGLVYYEQFPDPISAITREKEIKGWRRQKKNALVATLNPKWEDLTELLFGDTRKPARAVHVKRSQYRQSLLNWVRVPERKRGIPPKLVDHTSIPHNIFLRDPSPSSRFGMTKRGSMEMRKLRLRSKVVDGYLPRNTRISAA